MADTQDGPANGPAQGAPQPTPKPRGALQIGLINYIGDRWGPKNPTGRFIFDIAIWIPPLLILAIFVKLAQG
jgi:hypothetical protein